MRIIMIDKCVNNVYNITIDIEKGGEALLKRRDLIRNLEKIGFILERNGGNHDVYVRGDDKEIIPRHNEINERLAKAILKKWGL